MMKSTALFCLALSLATASAQLVRQANTTLSFPSSLPSPSGYTVENAIGTTTFANPICLRTLPGVTNTLFVVERGGTIQKVNLDTNTKSTFCDLATFLTAQGSPITTSSEAGLLSLAFHPNYNQNGYYFIFYSFNSTSATGSQLHQRVARLRATGTAGNYHAATTTNVATTHTPLITQRDEAGNHNGGDLHFGADGYLYISAGDEGAQNDGSDNARRINRDFLAGIMRIDVDRKLGSLAPNSHSQANSTAFPSAIHPGTYAIPPDNPFIGFTSWNGYTFAANTVRTEWWAHGFRNPWRMSFDPPTGRLFVADVGQDTWEEVSIVTKGANGGWSWREGAQTFTPAVAPATPPSGWTSLAPIYDYPHSTGDQSFRGSSITGGVIYRGSRLTELTGRYVFADYVSGRIWSLTDTGAARWTPALLYDETDSRIAAFGTDPRNGDVLYCFLSGTGSVKRLVRSFTGTAPPATLSATGAFSNLSTLTPNAGIVGYEANVPFWSDHAIKTRWFSIPTLANRMTYAANGNWTFPDGQVWIKHMEIELERGNAASRKRLETRFLVKNASGAYGITYKWRPDNSNADLVGDAGLDETLSIVENGNTISQTWRYPSRGECMSCHTAASGYALSFNSVQLNRLFQYGAQQQNIISALSGANYFTTPVTGIQTLKALAPTTDTTQSLEWRARSYLATNCSQCHQPGGVPGNWDARISTATDAAGLINGLLTNTGGNPAHRFIVPGDLNLSMVLKRIRGDLGHARMPPIATSVVDQAGVDLMTAWITELATRRSFTDWQTFYFGSPAAPNADPEDDPDGDGVTNVREYLLSTNPQATSADALLSPSVMGGNIELIVPEIPGRSGIVETTTDFQSWLPLDHPNNTPKFPANSGTKTLVFPIDSARRFLRLKIESL